MNLNTPDYSILNWLAILLENRKFNVAEGLPQRAKTYILENFKVDYKQYDIIMGYRANDSYFSYAGDFVNGTLSLSDLSEAMRLGKLGEQIVLKSDRAFGRLRFIGGEKADAETWYEKKTIRDREARRAYRSNRKATDSVGGLYMLDIMREDIRNGDPRLR